MVSFSLRTPAGHKDSRNDDGSLAVHGLRRKLRGMGLMKASTYGVFYSCFRQEAPSMKREREETSAPPPRKRRRVVLSDDED